MNTEAKLEYRTGLPASVLRPYLGVYIGYTDHNPVPQVRYEFSASRIVAILGWKGQLRVSDPRGGGAVAWSGRALVAGPYDSYVVTDSRGTSEAVQLSFTALGARRLLGVPLSELTNTTVDPGLLDGNWLDPLIARLAETSGWSRRFALLDQALCRRWENTVPVDSRMCRALEAMRRCGGRVRVERLARELGCSRRHLTAVFGREFGLPPKTMARLFRFEHALRSWRSGVSDWGRIAVECGFSDQSHLINEFQRLSGDTPLALTAHGGDDGLFPFLQDLTSLPA